MKPYILPKLPYQYSGLEPFIDEKTMRVHHDGHHRDYVAKLNDALEPYPAFQKRVEELLGSVEALPVDIKTAVKNNAGGHANHSLFWTILTHKTQDRPKDSLEEAIDRTFTNYTNFRTKFTETAIEHFSSGWAWLCTDAQGVLSVFSTKDHESPISMGLTPLLVLDLWEHAYYLKHQNRRADYVKTFWNIINWEEVSRRWEEFQKKGFTTREWKMTG